MKSLRKMLMVAAAFAPSPLFACAACYGRSDEPMALGFNWAILTLLGVLLTVLTCVAVFFVHVIRKEDALAKEDAPKTPTDL